ncbi:MAG: hypothetical protein KDC38_12015, partial [Planctomycetes bacterium]|nr:hypothetical protein [Planctomycetota bacterium]
YTHSLGCSITGGRIYRGASMPALDGTYFYADYCSGRIWSGEINGTGTALTGVTQIQTILAPPAGQGSIASISGFGEDAYGDIYIMDLAGGELFKIVPANIEDLDCNGNFIVDSIEGLVAGTDCNSNGIDDLCEVQTGQASDCNGNDIPDECDVASGLLPDCDGNGIADLCDVLAGTVEDCNGNQIPDSCDISSGVLADVNEDGLPDSCDYYVIQALDLDGVPGGTAFHTTVGTFPDPIGGYSMALEFDPSQLQVAGLTLDGTPAEVSDFFAPNFDNVEGWFTVGVAVDISPPIDSSIPAGLSVPLLITEFQVAGGLAVGTTSEICVVGTIGNPPVTSVFSSSAGVSFVPYLDCGVFAVIAGTPFTRGDANDDGGFDISDAVYALSYLFSGGPALACDDSGDVNDDGAIDISDPVYALGTLFTGGPPPPAPYPGCGIDPTMDGLTCDSFSNCP